MPSDRSSLLALKNLIPETDPHVKQTIQEPAFEFK